MILRRLSLILACCFVGPSLAYSADCDEAVTQVEMNDCAVAGWEEADARLNEVYGQAMGLLAGWDADLPEALQGGPETLRKAQRSWITFRDAACAVEGWPMRGGSAEPLLVYGCRQQLTEQRVTDLEALLEYQEY